MKSTSVILGVFLTVFGVINAYPLGLAGLGYPLGGHSYSVSHSLPHAGYGLGVGLPYGGSSYSVSHAVPHAGYGLGLGYGYGLGYGAGIPHVGTSVHSVSHGAPLGLGYGGYGLGLGYGYGLGAGIPHVGTSVHSVSHGVPSLGLGYGYGLGLGVGLPHASTTTSVSHGNHFGLPGFGLGLGAINSAYSPLSPGYGYGFSTFPGLYTSAAKTASGGVLGNILDKDSSAATTDAKPTDSTGASDASDVSVDPSNGSAGGDKTPSNFVAGNLQNGYGYGYPSFRLYKKK